MSRQLVALLTTSALTLLLSRIIVLHAAADYNIDRQWQQPQHLPTVPSPVTYPLPPSIYQGPEPSLRIYRVDELVDLLCAASGSPRPTYEWYKNGHRLDLTGSHTFFISQGTIRISHATALDEGFYQCVAKNKHGTAMSSVVHLRRAVLQYYQSAEPREYRVREGQRLTMECNAPRSVPNATYSWSIARDIDTSPVHLAVNRRVQVNDNGDLYFAYVKRTDVTREGHVYKCNVFNPYLDLTTTGSYSIIHVLPSERPGSAILQTKPAIHFSSNAVVALEKQTAVVRCFFSGFPEPTITWRRSGRPFPTSRHRYANYNTELIITNVQPSDEGVYVCRGSNSNGDSEQTIYVDVQAVPEFENVKDGPHNVNVTAGQSVAVHCRTRAEPPAHIVWYQNGHRLNTKELPSNFRLSADEMTLTLRRMCKDSLNDDGLYCTPDRDNGPMVVQCNASNEHGYTFANGYINVLSPTVITKYPSDVELVPYQDVIFSCSATSDPSTTMTRRWFYENETIARERTVNVLSNGSLVLKLSEENDGGQSRVGTYRCVVTNGYSTAELHARLYLPVAPPVAVVKSSAASEFLWIGLLVAFVLLLLVLLLAVCFAQRHHTGSYYVDEKERKNGHDPEKDLADQYFHEYATSKGDEPCIGNSRASLLAGSVTLIKAPVVDDDVGGSLISDSGMALEESRYNEDGSFIGQYSTNDKYLRNQNRNGGHQL